MSKTAKTAGRFTPKEVRFIKSAWRPTDYPPPGEPEVAIVGRSNAGKSTLINATYGVRVAKVSGTPGKTRLLNFFQVGKRYRLVDLPGYGYASRGQGERKEWAEVIETYLSTRGSLVGVILVMDIRRDWTPDESDLIRWLEPLGVPWLLCLSKSDKLSRSQTLSREREISKALRSARVAAPGRVFACSSLRREGFAELEEHVFRSWIT